MLKSIGRRPVEVIGRRELVELRLVSMLARGLPVSLVGKHSRLVGLGHPLGLDLVEEVGPSNLDHLHEEPFELGLVHLSDVFYVRNDRCHHRLLIVVSSPLVVLPLVLSWLVLLVVLALSW